MAGCEPASLQTIRVGEIAITYLPDGEGHFVPDALFPASEADAWEQHAELLDDDGRYVATVGAFLIRTKDRTLVVDLGAGVMEFDEPGFGHGTCGRLPESMRQAGVDVADVDTVIYTHLHADHCGWTTGPGAALTFPNARHVIGDSSEWEFWRANGDLPFAPPAEVVLDPLEDRVEAASDGQIVAPGVTLLATPGHTPGHQTVVISSGADRAVILGDVMHCPLQVSTPEWGVLFDVDADMARRTRERMLSELEGEDVDVGCCHFPEAAFGRIVRASGRRTWRPVARV
jgi:glyoxylase-like metal-dependent hydrolase (beta-lactamase superfamily II)